MTGELGCELDVPAAQQRALYHALMASGAAHGLRNIGNRALDSLRLAKSYGIRSTEFTQSVTPGMCGLDRHVVFDKGDFIGREGALRERDAPSEKMLVTLAIEATDADASGFEPIKCDGRLVGWTTSGAYGHHVGQSLALGYVDRALAREAPDPPIVARRSGFSATSRRARQSRAGAGHARDLGGIHSSVGEEPTSD